jgi:hypothetical protein
MMPFRDGLIIHTVQELNDQGVIIYVKVPQEDRGGYAVKVLILILL